MNSVINYFGKVTKKVHRIFAMCGVGGTSYSYIKVNLFIVNDLMLAAPRRSVSLLGRTQQRENVVCLILLKIPNVTGADQVPHSAVKNQHVSVMFDILCMIK